MHMITEFLLSQILLPLIVGTVIYLAVSGIEKLISRWGAQQQLPDSVQVELSETDLEMVEKSRQVIQETFGDDLVKTLKEANNLDRVKLIDTFGNNLAQAYGLDITIDITADDSVCGFYEDNRRKLVFNVHRLMIDSNNPRFGYYARDAVDTIIHELRHAVQCQAIRSPSFWNVGAERARIWEENFHNYIDPEVDAKAYAEQPLDADAYAFTAEVMREVQ